MAEAIPRKEERIENAICFFASDHERITGTLLTHIPLYKYLAFLDYANMEKTGRSALELLYLTGIKHPLPIGIYVKLQGLKRECIIFLSGGQGRYLVKATEAPDFSFFSPLEASGMISHVETSAHCFAKAQEAADLPRRRRMRMSKDVPYDEMSTTTSSLHTRRHTVWPVLIHSSRNTWPRLKSSKTA